MMPVEIMTVSLKLADFFERNPALDVPPSLQSINKSVLVVQTKEDGSAANGIEQSDCCSI